MGRPQKKKRKGNRPARRPPRNPAAPKLHVEVALANMDLRAATDLIKPAVLYADDVTVYSPAASLFGSIREMSRIRDPRDQLAVAVGLIQEVPQLREQLDASNEVLGQLQAFLALDPKTVRLLTAAHGGQEQVDKLNDGLRQLNEIWSTQLPAAVEAAKASLGAEELLLAVEAGAVRVADLSGDRPNELIAESLRLATGERSAAPIDDLLNNFVGRMLTMLVEPRAFPLFDAESTGLLRAIKGALDTTAVRSEQALLRGAEVTAAARFMGFLPNFADLPMDEALDIRSELRDPLTRFRGAMARLSRDFEARPLDETFDVEVEGVWRRDVEPALLEVREALAEHGLLREVASVALGDPRRLIVEAGGVVAAVHGAVPSLSGVLTSALAAGVPVADVLGRAMNASRSGRRAPREHAFYFLHQVASSSASRGR